jgi:hypothetical protein
MMNSLSKMMGRTSGRTTSQQHFSRMLPGWDEYAASGVAVWSPGACQETEAFLGSLRYGADCFTQIPFGRWDLDAYFDPHGQDDSKSYVNHGAFI